MEIEKAKETLELMLMVDTPMTIIASGGILKEIKEGKRVDDEWYKEYLAVRDCYKNIDASRLTNETGRPVVERLQPIVREYFEIFESLWKSYVDSDYQSQEIPQRLWEIKEIVLNSLPEFDKLTEDTYRFYHIAWDVHYFTSNLPNSNHTKWIINGKPTQIHPERLPLALARFMFE